MLIDYHIHTKMSGDAKGEISDCIGVAYNIGLTEIGFSDHFATIRTNCSMNQEELVQYIEEIGLYNENSSFPVKLGLEVDFIPNCESEIEDIVKLGRFDYVIGSVHFIKNWCFDNPKYVSAYKKWDITELNHIYFNLVNQCVKSGLFDIIGHVDLIKKFGYKPKIDMSNIFMETIGALKESKVCVEVNTSGLRAPCREIYPNKAFLKMCFDNRIPITLGSDAHMPNEVGKNFGQALKLIKEVGYKNIARFTDRKLRVLEI